MGGRQGRKKGAKNRQREFVCAEAILERMKAEEVRAQKIKDRPYDCSDPEDVRLYRKWVGKTFRNQVLDRYVPDRVCPLCDKRRLGNRQWVDIRRSLSSHKKQMRPQDARRYIEPRRRHLADRLRRETSPRELEALKNRPARIAKAKTVYNLFALCSKLLEEYVVVCLSCWLKELHGVKTWLASKKRNGRLTPPARVVPEFPDSELSQDERDLKSLAEGTGKIYMGPGQDAADPEPDEESVSVDPESMFRECRAPEWLVDGTVFAEERIAKDWTQTELADILGWSRQRIGQLETLTRTVSDDIKNHIVREFPESVKAFSIGGDRWELDGTLLVEARIDMGIGQREFARRAGWNRAYQYHLESVERSVNDATRGTILQVLREAVVSRKSGVALKTPPRRIGYSVHNRKEPRRG